MAIQFPIFSSPASSFEYTVWTELLWSVIAAVPSPSGVALSAEAGMLYVSSYSEGFVYALDLRLGGALMQHVAITSTGLAGLALDHQGSLWFASSLEARVGMLGAAPCPQGGNASAREHLFIHGPCANGIFDSGNGESDVDCGGSR